MVYLSYTNAFASKITKSGIIMTATASATATDDTFNNAYSISKKIADSIAEQEVNLLVYVVDTIFDNIFLITSDKLSPDLYLKGNPTCTTPDMNSSNNQIATTKFVNDIITKNLPESYVIKTITNEIVYQTTNNISQAIDNITNVVNFYHVNEEYYNIDNKINLVIDVPSTIYLPSKIDEGIVITIVNKSGGFININSKENQLIYNLLYLPPDGGNTMILNNNTTSYFIFITNTVTNISSWTVSVY